MRALIEKPRQSALLRMVATTSIATVFLGALAVGGLYFAIKSEANNQLLASLEADRSSFSDIYAQRKIVSLREALERRARDADPDDHIFILYDQRGNKIAGNLGSWPVELTKDNVLQDFTLTTGTQPIQYRGVGTNLPGGFAMMNARATTQFDSLLQRYLVAGAIAVVLLALLGALSGWWFSARIVNQISYLNNVCTAVELGDMDKRSALPDRGDEFSVLGNNLNRVLDRVNRLNRATLSLSDNIAHELRTPLNRILLTLNKQENAEKETGFDEIRDEASDEVRNTIELFDALLDIHSNEADATNYKGFSAIDLNDVLDDVLDLYEAAADEKGISINRTSAGPAIVLGDRTLLMRMVANVVDNALKFTGPEGKIDIDTKQINGQIVLTISDDGPGIPHGMEDGIFQQFVRTGTHKHVAGHGLGLALVKAIATRHGFKTELPKVRKGFAICFKGPALER